MAKHKILLIEDSDVMRALLQDRLEYAGYSVAEAADGEAGLAAAAKERPDLILLDIMMPKLDGIAVCRQIKADPLLRHIPVIFLTVKAQDKDIKEGYAAGADGYITKPYEIEIIISEIKKHLA